MIYIANSRQHNCSISVLICVKSKHGCSSGMMSWTHFTYNVASVTHKWASIPLSNCLVTVISYEPTGLSRASPVVLVLSYEHLSLHKHAFSDDLLISWRCERVDVFKCNGKRRFLNTLSTPLWWHIVGDQRFGRHIKPTQWALCPEWGRKVAKPPYT